MIRGLLSAVPKNGISGLFSKFSPGEFLRCATSIKEQQNASFTSLVPGAVNSASSGSQIIAKYTKPIFLEPKLSPLDQVRTVIKYSLSKGKRKSVKTVTRRFFRLHWGIWIRTMAGRKDMWAKSVRRRNKLLTHVFCNATQTKLLDKMAGKYWWKPRYYIEDPYAPYHKRENFPLTRKKPWRPEGVDYE